MRTARRSGSAPPARCCRCPRPGGAPAPAPRPAPAQYHVNYEAWATPCVAWEAGAHNHPVLHVLRHPHTCNGPIRFWDLLPAVRTATHCLHQESCEIKFKKLKGGREVDLEGKAPLVALVIGADENAVCHAIWLAAAGQHLLKYLLRCLPLSRCAAIMNQSSGFHSQQPAYRQDHFSDQSNL